MTNKLLFYYCLFWACVYCLFGCKTTEQHFNAGIKKNKPKMAALTRQTFPCTTTDTLTLNKYDTLYEMMDVRCPDSIQYRTDSFETSFAVRVPVYVKAQVMRIRETVTHTIRVEDSAKIFIADYALCEANKKVEKQKDKLKVRNQFIKWLIIALAVSIFINFWPVIKRVVKSYIKPI